MRYESVLETEDKQKLLYNTFKVEVNKQVNNRAGYKLEWKSGKIYFKIWAKDSTALRATYNTITKLITVCEKMNVIENE